MCFCFHQSLQLRDQKFVTNTKTSEIRFCVFPLNLSTVNFELVKMNTYFMSHLVHQKYDIKKKPKGELDYIYSCGLGEKKKKKKNKKSCFHSPCFLQEVISDQTLLANNFMPFFPFINFSDSVGISQHS